MHAQEGRNTSEYDPRSFFASLDSEGRTNDQGLFFDLVSPYLRMDGTRGSMFFTGGGCRCFATEGAHVRTDLGILIRQTT